MSREGDWRELDQRRDEGWMPEQNTAELDREQLGVAHWLVGGALLGVF